jgi:pyruvate formate lyase activating enzyme
MYRSHSCVEICPKEAIILKEERVVNIDRNKCDLCYQCTEVCPSGALEITGRSLTIREVMEEVMQDKPFYINSGGGVTFSGGGTSCTARISSGSPERGQKGIPPYGA